MVSATSGATRHLAKDWFYDSLFQLVTPQEATSSGQSDINRLYYTKFQPNMSKNDRIIAI